VSVEAMDLWKKTELPGSCPQHCGMISVLLGTDKREQNR